MNKEKVKTMDLQTYVAVTVEGVKKDICDHYCKWPNMWDKDKEGLELYRSDICGNCPLNRL